MLLWPAEWEEHSATWMIWPARIDMWPNITKAYEIYAKVANTIAKYEPVNMVVNQHQLDIAKNYLGKNITLISEAVDDSWARDVMPIFSFKADKLLANNFDFNCWGNKFSPFDNDRRLKNDIAKQQKWQVNSSKMILEGGAVHSNGQGVLLTTEECLLNLNRNPNMQKEQIESELISILGVKKILWLPYGVAGDFDTDGHVDNVACFANKNTIIIQSCYDENDENFARHQANMTYLDKYASEFNIVEIPQPRAQYFAGERLALSYLNFYIVNNAIIMPAFDDPNDAAAFEILQKCFKDRSIEQLNIIDLVVSGGGIHCITMQQPAIKEI
ncbi:agmatine deiminase family protein [Francisella tularensis subsp. novicida]|uniref:agmatine deiminase family protein n=1 Tax=Francisella tularensis TaxID=263 RepID=UPI000158AC19|nr:agmatine deiminase family protein [Francisella tularensis]AJI45225.1 porphyromonas-type peptidyl-arginine deiminase family protein [Francisella tularensis subsp. novicida F6168]AJJ46466.1 porphyromonas-type peptidyl-arginine deiminase family protein [Francisella tularensis subsp. novicida]APC99408.1 porphyromonas-type peptidyl-arginine deiminase family protein [Francisella tularensis subsp. novicida]EDN35873.1 conserved hypothetical protein [Francisella tularensis subsp. novicida GA99-3549]